jgi:hypothetical protein
MVPWVHLRKMMNNIKLFITKSCLPFQTFENAWLQHWHCGCVHEWFSLQGRSSQKRFYSSWRKRQNIYVSFAFEKCLLAMTTFDFFTSMGAHDIFALLVCFISTNW